MDENWRKDRQEPGQERNADANALLKDATILAKNISHHIDTNNEYELDNLIQEFEIRCEALLESVNFAKNSRLSKILAECIKTEFINNAAEFHFIFSRITILAKDETTNQKRAKNRLHVITYAWLQISQIEDMRDCDYETISVTEEFVPSKQLLANIYYQTLVDSVEELKDLRSQQEWISQEDYARILDTLKNATLNFLNKTDSSKKFLQYFVGNQDQMEVIEEYGQLDPNPKKFVEFFRNQANIQYKANNFNKGKLFRLSAKVWKLFE